MLVGGSDLACAPQLDPVHLSHIDERESVPLDALHLGVDFLQLFLHLLMICHQLCIHVCQLDSVQVLDLEESLLEHAAHGRVGDVKVLQPLLGVGLE